MEKHFGDGANRRARMVETALLSEGDSGEAMFDAIDGRFGHFVEKHADVSRHGFEETPLAFGIKGIECEARFAGTAHARQDRHAVHGDMAGEIFEVIGANAVQIDGLNRVARIGNVGFFLHFHAFQRDEWGMNRAENGLKTRRMRDQMRG